MSLGSSTTPARITLPSSARALGALHALISIALAVLLALGVQRLARHAFVEGLAMLIGVVVVPAIVLIGSAAVAPEH